MTDEPGQTAQFRTCPKCGAMCRAAATKCGACWAGLTALPPGDPGIETLPLPDNESRWDNAEMQQYRDAPRRDCPRCGKRIMAAASTCGFCWVKVTPITVAAVTPQHLAAGG